MAFLKETCDWYKQVKQGYEFVLGILSKGCYYI